MKFLDWLGRTLAVTLSLMVTLSIIGAIASIPSGNVGSRFVTEEISVVGPDFDPAAAERAPSSAQEEGREGGGTGAAEGIVTAAETEPESSIARWLEAITFALLAIAGLMALGVLILMRMLVHLSRLRGDVLTRTGP